MSNLHKILDRVRKMLALAENAGTEAEAANAAARAAALMEEYQLSEALVRLDNPAAKPEAILRDEKLGNANTKRVAWRECLSHAIAHSLGVKTYQIGAEILGFGRESSIQTWRYTYQHLCREVDAMCDQAWEDANMELGTGYRCRSWKNAFRVGCASRLSQRIYLAAEATEATRATAKAAAGAGTALMVVERDREELESEYSVFSRDFGSAISGIGSISSGAGYDAGTAAGDSISLGAKRAGLPAGQGKLT